MGIGSEGNLSSLNPTAIPFANTSAQVGTLSAALPAEAYDDPHSASAATHTESLQRLPLHLAQRRNSWDGTLLGIQLGDDESDDDDDDSDASGTSRPPSV
jgi:hypothetical protein